MAHKNDHDVKTFKQGRMIVEMMPEGYIILNRELATGLHPKLEAILSAPQYANPDDIDLRLAAIATYCGIVLKGVYTLEQRSQLCCILAGRLEVLRDFPGSEVIRS